MTVPEKPNDVVEAISFPQKFDILRREDSIFPYIDSKAIQLVGGTVKTVPYTGMEKTHQQYSSKFPGFL